MHPLSKPSVNLARDADDKARKDNLDRILRERAADAARETRKNELPIGPITETPRKL